MLTLWRLLMPCCWHRYIDALYTTRPDDHWGVWLTKDGWRYEGWAVDNHFDTRQFSGECHVTCPAGVYEGTLSRGACAGCWPMSCACITWCSV